MKLAPAAFVVPSRIRAIAELADRHPGTLRLFYGEDSLPTPDFIKDAAHRALDANHTFYTPNAGYPALARGHRRPGGEAPRCRGRPDGRSRGHGRGDGGPAPGLPGDGRPGGTSAVVLTPLWPNVAAAIRVAGAEAIEVPLALGPEGFRLDLDRIEAAVRPDTRLLALASPGNPTAWTATPEDWRKLVELCERHDPLAPGRRRLRAPGL